MLTLRRRAPAVFLIPLGMLNGAAVDVSAFLLRNLLPVTLGNVVGGGLLIASCYWCALSVLHPPHAAPLLRTRIGASVLMRRASAQVCVRRECKQVSESGQGNDARTPRGRQRARARDGGACAAPRAWLYTQ